MPNRPKDSIGTKVGDKLEEKVADAYEQVKSGVQGLASKPRSGRTRTRDELYAEAKKLGIRGRSSMSKEQLEKAIRKA